jgi:hypothetical protein
MPGFACSSVLSKLGSRLEKAINLIIEVENDLRSLVKGCAGHGLLMGVYV